MILTTFTDLNKPAQEETLAPVAGLIDMTCIIYTLSHVNVVPLKSLKADVRALDSSRAEIDVMAYAGGQASQTQGDVTSRQAARQSD